MTTDALEALEALSRGPEVTDVDFTRADPEAVRDALSNGGRWVLRRCRLGELDLSGSTSAPRRWSVVT
ncbi:hypothetical protein [Actinomycetospora aeridis]|uniref:Uncharacterized protein n=1 Tax=Actinomycetospora aeridis TaxID=3129231 RepID=A0ABU8N409_9PSEU